MSVAKKHKAWRGHMRHWGHNPLNDLLVTSGERPKNCTVIPDGAVPPQSAALKRLIKAQAAEIEQLRRIGGMMANVMFNLSQRDGQEAARTMKDLQRQWDSIPQSKSLVKTKSRSAK